MIGRNLFIVLVLFLGAVGLAMYSDVFENVNPTSANSKKPLTLACTWEKTDSWVIRQAEGGVKDYGSKREKDIILEINRDACVYSSVNFMSVHANDDKIKCEMRYAERQSSYRTLDFNINRYTGNMTKTQRYVCKPDAKRCFDQLKEDKFICSEAKKKF